MQEPEAFRAILTPHRSLSAAGFLLLMAVIAVASFVTGLAFMLIGAWPVMLFCGLDAALIYLAFRLNYRAGRLVERVEIDPAALRLVRRHPSGREEHFEFNAYWVRVRLDQLPDGRNELKLASHGRELAFGHFLTDDERRDLAVALGEALHRRRHAGAEGHAR